MSDPQNDTNLAASANPADERRAQLAALIPEAFTEGKLDVAALKRALGDAAVVDGERYALTWAGKANAYKVLQTPSTATLRPERDKSVNFDAAQHVFIEGENLEVLKVLQKAYFGKVKLIYIDPPYNTGSDSFIYPDRFQESKEDYLRRINELDDDGTLMREGFFRKNSKENGHYHSNWLSMMLPRLYIARNLLREDGVIFVSCDDNEVHNLRGVMNEVFGEENFVAARVWEKSKKGDSKLIGITHEYMLCMARNKNALLERGIWRKRKEGVDEVLAKYKELRQNHGIDHSKIEEAMRAWYASLSKNDPRRAHEHYKCSDDRGLYFPDNFHGPDDGRASRPRYDILHPITGKPCKKPTTGWRWEELRTKKALALNPPLIHFGVDETTIPCRKSYLHVVDSEPMQSVFYKDGRAGTLVVEQLVGKGVFDFPKDVETLRELIEVALKPRPKKAAWTEDDEDSIEPPRFDEVNGGTSVTSDEAPIVMDFFAGSGSTAHAVVDALAHGTDARFVLIQLPEPTDRGEFQTVAEVGRTRIKKVIESLQVQADLISDAPVGLGFKSFLLTPSNFKQWRGDFIDSAEQLAEQIQLFTKGEKEDAQIEDMLYELLLKFGQELTTPVETLDVAGSKVFAIHERKMLFVLESFRDEMIDPLVDMRPREIIVIDGVFKDSDMLKSNLDLQCRDAGIKFTCL